MFLKILGKNRLSPVYRKPRPGDIKRSQADISKAEKLLGYKPKIPLEIGVKNLLHSLGILQENL
jgi:nucleoside-diphosphate-sugar epimerase